MEIVDLAADIAIANKRSRVPAERSPALSWQGIGTIQWSYLQPPPVAGFFAYARPSAGTLCGGSSSGPRGSTSRFSSIAARTRCDTGGLVGLLDKLQPEDASMVVIDRIIDHSILTSALPQSGAVVLDCGANHGDFAKWAADRLNATVYSFEADPELANRLSQRNGVRSFNIAIAGEDGQMTLRRAPNRCTSGFFNTDAQAEDTFVVEARSLESFCTENGIRHVDLLKLDIEGGELDVLERGSPEFFSRVDQITCEFHDFLDKNQLPRIKAVIERMRRLGFVVIRMSFWTYGDMLMINRRSRATGPWGSSLIRFHKYAVGVRRLIHRIIVAQSSSSPG